MNKFLSKFMNVRLSEKLYKDAEKIADSQGMTISSFVRNLIVKAVLKTKKKEEKE